MTRVSTSSLPSAQSLLFAAQKSAQPFAGINAPQADRVTFSSVPVRFGLSNQQQAILPQSQNGLVREGVALLLRQLRHGNTHTQLTHALPPRKMGELMTVLTDPDISKPANVKALEEALCEISAGLQKVKSKAQPVVKRRELVSALQDALAAKKAIMIPGLTAPKSSLQEIETYVEENLGYKATTIKLFPIATGLGLKNLAPLLGDYVDDYRILAARANTRLFDILMTESANPAGKVRQMMGLESSDTGRAIAKACLETYQQLARQLPNLKTPMVNTGPQSPIEVVNGVVSALRDDTKGPLWRVFSAGKAHVEGWQSVVVHQASRLTGYEVPDMTGLMSILTNRKKPEEKLSTYVSTARQELTAKVKRILKESGELPKAERGVAAAKLANRGIDLIFNRMILMGHSMGGTATLKTMQQTAHDTYGHGDLDVGMSFCLASPVNGVSMPPKDFDKLHAFLTTVSPALREQVLGLARSIPAVRDMEAGSEAVEKMQSRPTPVDATTISIANPEDGLVPEEGAKLKTQSDDPDNPDQYVNHHNFTVTPKVSPLDSMMPKVRGLSTVMKGQLEQARASGALHGLEQHCTVVQHMDKHFEVDGEVMQQIFAEARQPDRLRRLLHANNYEPMREHILDLITDRVSTDSKLRRHYQKSAMRVIFEELAANPLPLEDGVAQKAERLLAILDN